MTESANELGGALLIDTENLFQSFGFWADGHYKKLTRYPGLDGAVEINVNSARVKSLARNALRSLVAWAADVSMRELTERRSYGKDSDSGVRSVKDAFQRTGVRHIPVPPGRDQAENALIADFEALQALPAQFDTFVFGGEDHLVREAVLARLQRGPIRFAFVVPDTNVKFLRNNPTTGRLNAGEIAILPREHGRDRYYATLSEAVVPTAAAIKADLAVRPQRATEDEPSPAAEASTEDHSTAADDSTWVRIVLRLIARRDNPLRKPRNVGELSTPAWRASLRAALQTALPDLSALTDELADRLGEVFSTARHAAAEFGRPGTPGIPGSGWPTLLAAAALYPEVRDGRLALAPDHPAYWAFVRAQTWLAEPANAS